MKPCAWPHNRMSVEPDGWTRPCCGENSAASRVAPLEEGIQAAFDNRKIILLHQVLQHDGFTALTRPYCRRCEILEDQEGVASMRQGTPELSHFRELRMIQFKLSTKCQLACGHCGPDLSSTWRKMLEIKPVNVGIRLSTERLDELAELLPQLEELKFTGGEPFLDPMHWKVLDRLQFVQKSHCTLHYTTNGQQVPTDYQLRLWEGWKAVKVTVSVDGFEATYEWFRRNASWDLLVQNVNEIADYATVNLSYSVTPWTASSFSRANDTWPYKVLHHPVVHPTYASLVGFPSEVADEHFVGSPYLDLCKFRGDLTPYREWALKNDAMFNTPGVAQKLFPWLNYQPSP